MSARKNTFHITDKRIRSAVMKSLASGGGELTPLETRILVFAMKRQIKTDLPSRLKKLGEEIGELAEAIANRDFKAVRLESADCAIVLAHIGILARFSLQQAMIDKMTENEGRHLWQAPEGTTLYHCSRCGTTTIDLAARKNEQCKEAQQ